MPEDQKRTRAPMMIRFSPEERAALDAEAREASMATGTWIRATCLRIAKEQAKKRGGAPVVLRNGSTVAIAEPKPDPLDNVRGSDEPVARQAAPLPSLVDQYLTLAREFSAAPEGSTDANALAVELQSAWDRMTPAEQDEARGRL